MGVLKDLNYIKNVYAHPCKNVPGMDVIIETAAIAAFVSVVTFHVMDCNDIMVEAAKKHMRDPLRPGHRSLKPSGARGNTRNAYNGSMSLFENIVIPARTLGSGFFVFGLAIQAFSRWTSMMYAAAECDSGNHQYRDVLLSLPFVVIAGAGPHPMGLAGSVGTGCILVGGHVVTIPAGCLATVTYTTKWKIQEPDLHPDAFVETWLQTSSNRIGPRQKWPDAHTLGGKTIGGMHGVHGDPGASVDVSVIAEAHNGNMVCESGSIAVTASGLALPSILGQSCGAQLGKK